MNYHLTTTILGVGLATAILYMVRRDHLHGPYAYWWLTVAAATVTFGFYPRLIDKLAAYAGVAYAPTLLFSLAIALMLVKMLKGDIERSRHERKIRRLAQHLAILTEENRRLRERLDSSADDQQPRKTASR